MASSRFDFENRDGRKLSGVLETGEGAPRAYAVFAHCFTCSKTSLAAVRVSRALASRGLATYPGETMLIRLLDNGNPVPSLNG